VLDRLGDAGVERAVVNVHHFGEQIIAHVAGRTRPRITISDERGVLLDTGGGVVKALPELGAAPFYHLNADTIWIDGPEPNLTRLAQTYDVRTMDALLLLAPTQGSIGYAGRGDFFGEPDGRLRPRAGDAAAPFVYAGAAILTPALFKAAPAGAFSLTTLFHRAAASGRLHGLPMQGLWMHVGTPEAIKEAEAAMRRGAG